MVDLSGPEVQISQMHSLDVRPLCELFVGEFGQRLSALRSLVTCKNLAATDLAPVLVGLRKQVQLLG